MSEWTAAAAATTTAREGAHLGQADLVDELEEEVDVDRVAKVPLGILCTSLEGQCTLWPAHDDGDTERGRRTA